MISESENSSADRKPQTLSNELDSRRIRHEILGTDNGADPFVAAVRATRMPMVITNPRLPDNPVVFANDAFCRLSGYERSEILGRNCRFLQGPATDRNDVQRVHDAVAGRRSIQIDLRNYRKDGSAFWNRLLLAPVRDELGEVTYFFASQLDVTLEREKLIGLEHQNAALIAELGDRLRSQEQSEARLRELLALNEKFQTLAEPAAIAFAAAEMLGRLLNVSRAGYGTVDLSAETITIARDWNAPGIKTLAGRLNFRDYGSYIDDLKHGVTVTCADARLDPRTAATADALQGISALAFINMPVTESDGLVALLYLNHEHARIWTDDEMAFVREVASRTRMAVQRREAEQQLKTLAETLEAQVQARTAELMRAEEALRQSQKMEAVGQLTGGIAHDFNNLLAGISASLEILDRKLGNGRTDEAPRYIAAARNSARRAASLTQRLLAFSRRQTLDPQAIDVNRLVTGMEDLVRRTVGPAVEVEVVGAVGLWSTKADPAQLENALLNLCINGRDAMVPAGGRLTIETANKWLDDRTARERDIPPGQYISLCVSDTGHGMPADIIARAFDPFFTTKPLGEGTGLGLSMVYGFVKQSGGEVRIYSEVGSGTTVCLYLPRHAEAPVENETVHDESVAQGEGETVLVIEDEATIREFLVEELRENGYRVVEAKDGVTGLRHLQGESRVDLLITDVGLPGGMNGRQVADAARVTRPDLKVLFITGFADNAAVGNGRLAPGMEVLTKPFDLSALGARIRTILDR